MSDLLAWCVDTGVSSMSVSAFGRGMRARYEVKQKGAGAHYQGVGLLSEARE